ncbi:hypothetical protein AWJ20_2625 [Sugiyamaella lignohabitans]|uniref:NDT80 domain-containing protein n=1 Tax=Sugiyamaella lignohabitans TaxID=796027 RepID=A0A161HX95_9ASCO|nr:uncharacterized protein AWJ20_2625 [Sugiyamaella lignohabitans]ANB15006.1 hypothetical protein AWJ20_2625 [Sugiyamaella lignohabitans]
MHMGSPQMLSAEAQAFNRVPNQRLAQNSSQVSGHGQGQNQGQGHPQFQIPNQSQGQNQIQGRSGQITPIQGQSLSGTETTGGTFDQTGNAIDSPFQSFLSTLGESPNFMANSGLGNESKFFTPSPASLNIASPITTDQNNSQGQQTSSTNSGASTRPAIQIAYANTPPISQTQSINNSLLNPDQTKPAPTNDTQNASIYRGGTSVIANSSLDAANRRSDHMDEGIRQHLNSAKYLVFLPAHKETVLYDMRGNRTEIDLTVSLSGNFFLSEPHPSSSSANDNESSNGTANGADSGTASTTAGGGTNTPSIKQEPQANDAKSSPELSSNESPTSEKKDFKDLMKYDLTFYRRNLFHVSATVSNAHNAIYAGNSENPLLRSRILSLSLAVNVLDDKTPKQLLCCGPKSNFGANDPKAESQEPAVKLIYPKSSGYDEVVNWKRLQFRTATAHNGRKRLQNYFSVCVSVYAELENAQRVALVKSYSRPIVVRGRNPRFYQNRDNIFIPDGSASRGPFMGGMDRKLLSNTFKSEEAEEKPLSPMKSVNNNNTNQPAPQPSQERVGSVGSGTAKPVTVKQEQWNTSSDTSNTKASAAGTGALSLGEDDAHSDDSPGYVLKMNPADDGLSPKNKSGAQNRDIDYEYFPMPLNYWLPPVEVVYWPHSIHHPLKPLSNQPQGKQAQQLPIQSQLKSDRHPKRYFSAVD